MASVKDFQHFLQAWECEIEKKGLPEQTDLPAVDVHVVTVVAALPPPRPGGAVAVVVVTLVVAL